MYKELEGYVWGIYSVYKKKTPALAEDIRQECWLVYARLWELQGVAYIKQAMQNAARRYVRLNYCVVNQPSRKGCTSALLTEEIVETLLVEDDSKDTFEELLEEAFPNPTHKIILYLKDNGKTHEDIGKVLGISSSAVALRLKDIRYRYTQEEYR